MGEKKTVTGTGGELLMHQLVAQGVEHAICNSVRLRVAQDVIEAIFLFRFVLEHPANGDNAPNQEHGCNDQNRLRKWMV